MKHHRSSATPLPAATTVVWRQNDNDFEVLLLKRSSKLSFAPSSWVFPGGKVDQTDPGETEHDKARAAAVRELYEETQLSQRLENLLHFAQWVTPETNPKRFDTSFFIAKSETIGEVCVDGSEIVESQWLTPAEALSEHREGRLSCMPPTFVTLCEMAAHSDYAEVLTYYSQRGAWTYDPRIVDVGSEKCYLYPGDAGWMTRSTDASGDRHRLWIGSASDWRYELSLGNYFYKG